MRAVADGQERLDRCSSAVLADCQEVTRGNTMDRGSGSEREIRGEQRARTGSRLLARRDAAGRKVLDSAPLVAQVQRILVQLLLGFWGATGFQNCNSRCKTGQGSSCSLCPSLTASPHQNTTGTRALRGPAHKQTFQKDQISFKKCLPLQPRATGPGCRPLPSSACWNVFVGMTLSLALPWSAGLGRGSSRGTDAPGFLWTGRRDGRRL
jgi:hypothetical protein